MPKLAVLSGFNAKFSTETLVFSLQFNILAWLCVEYVNDGGIGFTTMSLHIRFMEIHSVVCIAYKSAWAEYQLAFMIVGYEADTAFD